MPNPPTSRPPGEDTWTPWTCHARPAALGGRRCGHENAAPTYYGELEVCLGCGCTRRASDLRRAREAALAAGREARRRTPALTEPRVAAGRFEFRNREGRGWRVDLTEDGRLVMAWRLLRGGLETPQRTGLPGRVRIAAKLLLLGRDPSPYLHEGETLARVPLATENPA